MIRKLYVLLASSSLTDYSESIFRNYTPNQARAPCSHLLPSSCAFLLSPSGRNISRYPTNFSTQLRQTRESSSSAEGLTLESIAESFRSGNYERVLVVAGAGVSCSAGIPDFRTPGSGLWVAYFGGWIYRIFDLNTLKHIVVHATIFSFFTSCIQDTIICINSICPTLKPFLIWIFTAKILHRLLRWQKKFGPESSIGVYSSKKYQWLETYIFFDWFLNHITRLFFENIFYFIPRPTLTHCFFSLLDKKGILRRIYTQNIDGLEVVAGVNPEKLVECHGHFRSASCIQCRAPQDADTCKASMLDIGVVPTCKFCGGFVKPDIIFFGEELPSRFSQLVHEDVMSCDLLIVVGTSLLVAPVAYIPEWVSHSLPRLLINRELVGNFNRKKTKDVFMEGDCDER